VEISPSMELPCDLWRLVKGVSRQLRFSSISSFWTLLICGLCCLSLLVGWQASLLYQELLLLREASWQCTCSRADGDSCPGRATDLVALAAMPRDMQSSSSATPPMQPQSRDALLDRKDELERELESLKEKLFSLELETAERAPQLPRRRPQQQHYRPEKAVLESGSTASSAAHMGGVMAAVVYLVKMGERDVRLLTSSLAYLQTNFCTRHGMGKLYPILLFSDAMVDDEAKSRFSAVAPSCSIQTELLSDFQVPDFVPAELVQGLSKQGPGGRGPGYALMIRWQLRQLFLHPAVQPLEYVLRLDTDSQLLSPFVGDPFLRMRHQGTKYGYYCACFENLLFSEGLHAFVANYVELRGLKSQWAAFDPHPSKPVAMPYNNIELVDVNWWRSQPVQEFINSVDGSLGIWRHRWGDAPLRGMAISLFLAPSELMHFRELSYAHPVGEPRKATEFEHQDAETAERGRAEEDVLFFGLCRSHVRTPEQYRSPEGAVAQAWAQAQASYEIRAWDPEPSK